MRIKGDVSFQRHRISQLNITYLVMTDCKKQEKISLFKQVLREIAMVSLNLSLFFLCSIQNPARDWFFKQEADWMIYLTFVVRGQLDPV